jgi:hypothetical protein
MRPISRSSTSQRGCSSRMGVPAMAAFWRPVSACQQLVIIFWRLGNPTEVFAVAILFWLFNRWTFRVHLCRSRFLPQPCC